MRSKWGRIVAGLAMALAALAVIFGLELTRERFLYRRAARSIESAHAQLKIGMTKDEVKAIAGEPQEIAERRPDEYWTWSSRGREGELWRRMRLTSATGHYDLIVRFDAANRITKIFGGVN
jgi:outer membrane protein assembly factor BamE (lipoprotein component of BamABCDE complex)